MAGEHETSLQAVARGGGIQYRWVCTCGQQGKFRSFPGHAAASGGPACGSERQVMTFDEWCPCGHLMLRHDVEEYRGDGTETCCVEGCTQVGCPGRKAKS